jgi:chaperonin GroES
VTADRDALGARAYHRRVSPRKALRPVDGEQPAGSPAPAEKRTRGSGRESPDSVSEIRLTADRLLVHVPDDRERRSKGGLLIPASAATPVKRCIWSDVVLVGPETRGVRAGDLVLFIPQSGLEVEVDGDSYLLLRERDVQAVASDRSDSHAGQYL